MSYRSKMMFTIAAASVLALAMSGCSTAETPQQEEDITLNLTWWGSDDTSTRYNEAIALYEEENPHITIKSSFAAYPDYWEKRTVEAAGNNLPDVMQFNVLKLREFAQSGKLLDLSNYKGGALDVSAIDDTLIKSGIVDDALNAVPTGTNVYGLTVNDAAATPNGKLSESMTWDDYADWVGDFDNSTGVYGNFDWTNAYLTFEIYLRQNGKSLFTPDDELGFTKQDLKKWWSSTQSLRDDQALVSDSRMAEVYPKDPMGAGLLGTQFTWNNALSIFGAALGSDKLSIVPPPTDHPKVKDLYLNPAQQLAVSSNTEHPEAAAKLVNFLTNDPRMNDIFGMTRGLPASSYLQDGLKLTGFDATVQGYQDSVADRLGSPPPPPMPAFGSLTGLFVKLGGEINLGTLSIDDAVEQFFNEAGVVL